MKAEAFGLMLAFLMLIVPASSLTVHQTQLFEPQSPPNIVLIVTDDQRWDTLSYMPVVNELLVAHGVTFTNAFVTTPLCCPSRASILTGQYAHHHGVQLNGYPGAIFSFDDSVTLATMLSGAGYTNGLFGKYLNAYDLYVDELGYPYVPPGWDSWFAFVARDDIEAYYYGYTVNDDGAIVAYDFDENDYSTDVLAEEAAAFIDAANEPFFAHISTWAPHSWPVPAQRHAGMFDGIAPWRPLSFNEPDVSDKPVWVHSLPPLDEARVDTLRQGQLETLRAVDDLVRIIMATLADRGLLDKTAVIFTSDNGNHWGEHRWLRKGAPYEESIRVPLIVRPPAGNASLNVPSTVSSLVLNLDLAPTILDIAGVTLPYPLSLDGRSLREVGSADWRTHFTIEAWHGESYPINNWVGLRTSRWKFVRHETGEAELYDLLQDPYELENHIGRPEASAIVTALESQIEPTWGRR